MESKNELFLNAVDYLIDEGLAEDQSDIAKRAGLGPNLISRVRTGKVKNVSDDSIRALVSKFNLNMDYFRGKSEYISRYDQSCANMEHELKEAQKLLDKDPFSNTSEPIRPEIPDYVKQLCEETARLAIRNEMLERQCENLIAELRNSKDKNDAFLAELKKSKENNDAMVAEFRISKKQNEALIAELRETKKNNGMLSTKLEKAIDTIEGMKAQMSMMLNNFNVIEQNQLGQLRVNDDGEPVIAIQVPNVMGDGKKTKARKVPNGYIRGDIKVITDLMIKQARAAFPPKKK